MAAKGPWREVGPSPLFTYEKSQDSERRQTLSKISNELRPGIELQNQVYKTSIYL